MRGMAATQLAEDGSQSAAAAIEQELARQSTHQATFNLANALEVLDDHQGTTTMARLCTDTSVPVDLRTSAAKSLLDHKDSSCFPAVIRMLSNSSLPSESQFMLETLNQAPAIALSARLSGSLTTALERSLQVNQNSVRQEAARCIVHFNLREAVPLLRHAAKMRKILRPNARWSRLNTTLFTAFRRQPWPAILTFCQPLGDWFAT